MKKNWSQDEKEKKKATKVVKEANEAKITPSPS